MLRYMCTGEIPIRGSDPHDYEMEQDLRGSMTYWNNPPNTPVLESNGLVFHTISMTEIHNHIKSGEDMDVMQAIVSLKRKQLTNLKKRLNSNKLSVDLRLGRVSTDVEAKPIIRMLQAAKPASISWSNLCDYGQDGSFHTVASTFKEATHYGYSMNWIAETFGTCISDFLNKTSPSSDIKGPEEIPGHEKIEELLNAAMQAKGDDLVVIPAFCTPVNLATSTLARRVQDKWIEYFLSSTNVHNVDAKSTTLKPSLVSVETVADENPLARTATTLYMTWKYE